MNPTPTPHPADQAMLFELAELGMRGARVVVRVMEVQGGVADLAGRWVAAADGAPDSLGAAVAEGQAADAAAAALAQAVPQVEGLSRALDRLSRCVRRSLALKRRLEAGWPRAGAVPADDRDAMVRRQVSRGVSGAIGRQSEGEAAERLFDELRERLDDPELDETLRRVPADEVVRQICRELGLAAEELAAACPQAGPRGDTS